MQENPVLSYPAHQMLLDVRLSGAYDLPDGLGLVKTHKKFMLPEDTAIISLTFIKLNKKLHNSLAAIEPGQGLISINSLVLCLTKLKPSLFIEIVLSFIFSSLLEPVRP